MSVITSLLFALTFGVETLFAESTLKRVYDYHCKISEQYENTDEFEGFEDEDHLEFDVEKEEIETSFRVVKSLGLGIFRASRVNEFGEVISDDELTHYKWNHDLGLFESESINNDEATRFYGNGTGYKTRSEVKLEKTDDMGLQVTISRSSIPFPGEGESEYELFYRAEGKCQKEAVVIAPSDERVCYKLNRKEIFQDMIDTQINTFAEVHLILNEEGDYRFGWPNGLEEDFIFLSPKIDEDGVFTSSIHNPFYELRALSGEAYVLSATTKIGYENIKSFLEITCMDYPLLKDF